MQYPPPVGRICFVCVAWLDVRPITKCGGRWEVAAVAVSRRSLGCCQPVCLRRREDDLRGEVCKPLHFCSVGVSCAVNNASAADAHRRGCRQCSHAQVCCVQLLYPFSQIFATSLCARFHSLNALLQVLFDPFFSLQAAFLLLSAWQPSRRCQRHSRSARRRPLTPGPSAQAALPIAHFERPPHSHHPGLIGQPYNKPSAPFSCADFS